MKQNAPEAGDSSEEELGAPANTRYKLSLEGQVKRIPQSKVVAIEATPPGLAEEQSLQPPLGLPLLLLEPEVAPGRHLHQVLLVRAQLHHLRLDLGET